VIWQISWPDFLNGPWWTFVGTLTAVTGVAIALLRWPRKRLWWELVQGGPIVGEDSNLETIVEFDGQKWHASDLVEAVIEVVNSGNQSIEAEHYTRPLTFDFGKDARIFVAEVLYEEPNGIGASVRHGVQIATLEPVLLNAGDILGVRVLGVGLRWPRLDGRIVDVKQIRMGYAPLRFANLGLLGAIMNICVGPAIIFPQLLPPPLLGVARALLVVGTVLAAVGVVISHRERRRWRRRREYVEPLLTD
jgi:hypothetical protein